MLALRSLVVSLLVFVLAFVLACRREMPPPTDTTGTTATSTSSTAATHTSAVTETVQLPACYPPTTTGGPSSILPVSISGNIPLFVPLPGAINSPIQIRPFFDWFSWEEFIALNWPASSQGRGNPQSPNDPSVFKTAAPGTPVVWGTYKANWELFDQGNQRPTPFDSYDVPVPPTCGSAPASDASKRKTLVMTAKGDSVLNDGVEAFSFPLVDTTKEYVMYEVRYARQPYDFMRGADNDPSSWLYLSKNVNAQTQYTMPPTESTEGGSPVNKLGSIMIKAAWRDMSTVPQDQWSRYYTTPADVYDPTTAKCSMTTVGLVGLHIVQKLDLFPEWVWSTFEHVDVLSSSANTLIAACPDTDPECKTNGYKNRPKTTKLLPNQNDRVPVQALRLNPIPTTPSGASTVEVNQVFQQALAGTPWANYQLVVTQWPFAANSAGTYKAPAQGGSYPCLCGQPFPVYGSVNLTMETYFQSQNSAAGQGNSCMQCHYGAAMTDFSWGLNRRPHS